MRARLFCKKGKEAGFQTGVKPIKEKGAAVDTAWELIMKRPGIKEPTGGSERGKESRRRKRTEAPSFRKENVLYFFLEFSPKREKTTIPTVGGYFSAAAVFIKGGRDIPGPLSGRRSATGAPRPASAA